MPGLLSSSARGSVRGPDRAAIAAEVIVHTDANGIEVFVHATGQDISFNFTCTVVNQRRCCLGYTAEVDILILAFNRPVGSKHPFDTDTGNPPPPGIVVVVVERVQTDGGHRGQTPIGERGKEIVPDATEGETARSVKQDRTGCEAETAAQCSKPIEP